MLGNFARTIALTATIALSAGSAAQAGIGDGVLGVAFAPNGRAFRFPAWSFESILMPWIVRRGIYRGVRD